MSAEVPIYPNGHKVERRKVIVTLEDGVIIDINTRAGRLIRIIANSADEVFTITRIAQLMFLQNKFSKQQVSRLICEANITLRPFGKKIGNLARATNFPGNYQYGLFADPRFLKYSESRKKRVESPRRKKQPTPGENSLEQLANLPKKTFDADEISPLWNPIKTGLELSQLTANREQLQSGITKSVLSHMAHDKLDHLSKNPGAIVIAFMPSRATYQEMIPGYNSKKTTNGDIFNFIVASVKETVERISRLKFWSDKESRIMQDLHLVVRDGTTNITQIRESLYQHFNLQGNNLNYSPTKKLPDEDDEPSPFKSKSSHIPNSLNPQIASFFREMKRRQARQG